VVLIAAAGVVAFETDTVSSYWQGLRWSISLITTVGFIGQLPHTVAGAIVSVILMVLGFIPLALVERVPGRTVCPRRGATQRRARDQTNREILGALHDTQGRLADLEARMTEPPDVRSTPLAGAKVGSNLVS